MSKATHPSTLWLQQWPENLQRALEKRFRAACLHGCTLPGEVVTLVSLGCQLSANSPLTPEGNRRWWGRVWLSLRADRQGALEYAALMLANTHREREVTRAARPTPEQRANGAAVARMVRARFKGGGR